jgi:hypothetical protein
MISGKYCGYGRYKRLAMAVSLRGTEGTNKTGRLSLMVEHQVDIGDTIYQVWHDSGAEGGGEKI